MSINLQSTANKRQEPLAIFYDDIEVFMIKFNLLRTKQILSSEFYNGLNENVQCSISIYIHCGIVYVVVKLSYGYSED